MEDKKSYFAVIPANVRYDERLSSSEKLLYGEITALCSEKGYCWATNGYFAKLYNVTKQSVSGWVSHLEQYGYIQVEFKEEGIQKNLNRYIKIFEYPHQKNLNTPIKKNLNHNNINNNNNIIIKRKNAKKKSESIVADFLAEITDNDLREAYQAFIEMRAEIKAPITTERMLNILQNKLEKITNDTKKQIDLLNEAIFHKWKSVYITMDKNANKGKITQDYGAFNLDDFERKLNKD